MLTIDKDFVQDIANINDQPVNPRHGFFVEEIEKYANYAIDGHDTEICLAVILGLCQAYHTTFKEAEVEV